MILKELTNEEFKSFSNKFHINSIYQSVEYAFIMGKQNFDCIFLGLFDEENIIAAGLFLIDKYKKNKKAYSPRGFLLDYNDFNLLSIYTSEIKKFFSKNQISSIIINPYIIKSTYDLKYNVISQNKTYNNIIENMTKLGYKHLGDTTYFETIKPRFEAVIDLNIPYYILFKNINKQFRTKIRSAKSNGIEVFKGNIDDLNYLYSQTKRKYKRDLKYFIDTYKYYNKSDNIELFYTKLNTELYVKNSQKKLQEYEYLANKINEELMKRNDKNEKTLINKKIEIDKLFNKYKSELVKATNLLFKYPDGIVTSSALIIKNKDEVYLYMDGYDTKFKSLNSKHLLIWKLCERYANLGFKKFNLGGITDINNKDNKYKGLNDFKLKFNAIAIEYIGDFELTIDNKFNFIKQSKKLKDIFKKSD